MTRDRVAGLQALGVLLFLFIPLVLYLFVAHPRPIAGSAAAGVALMLAHRFLARPYMEAARRRKCLWCNRGIAEDGVTLALRTGHGELEARVCGAHHAPASRFFGFLARVAPLLRVGIFLPLLLLLVALALAAAGNERWLAFAVPLFQLVVGPTVNVAAVGYLAAADPEPGGASAGSLTPPRVPFPAHNFFLLGVRNLLWVFRLVGLWWIVVGTLGLLRLRG